jgi:small subunit ribosomal protein S13
MVYILNTNLSNTKKVVIALKVIYGIGTSYSQHVCDQLGISEKLSLAQLTNPQIDKLSQFLRQNFITGSELNKQISNHKRRLNYISCYRGIRHSLGLPTRGQRTHGNAQTARKFKKRQYSFTGSGLVKKKKER